MTMTKRIALSVLGLVLVAGMAGCSSSGGDEEASGGDTTETTDTTDTSTTETTEAESGGEVASQEICDAANGVSTTSPEAIAAFVALFPEDLQDDAQDFINDQATYAATYDQATGTFGGDTPQPSEALGAFISSCAVGGGGETTSGGEPEFQYSGFQDKTYIVHGSCPDGSAPTNVEGAPPGFETEPVVAEDLGAGDFALAFPSLPDSFVDNEATRTEVGIPDLVTGDCP